MENQKQGQEKLPHEVAREVILKAIKDTKLVEAENNTGFSYFEGKKRLGKILKSKKGLALEINVELPKAIEDTYKLEKIPYAVAHKKHLGTMKYMHRMQDLKDLAKLVTEMVKAFKAEQEADTQAQEAK